MNISGIRPYEGFYEYNSIKETELRNQQIAASQNNPENQSAPEEERQETVVAAPEQNYTSYDYAQNYRPGETYELKGADSDINSLDIMKAVSDLDKDQVLRQYQYFVGKLDSPVTKTLNAPTDSELVSHTGENFSL